MTAQWLQMLTVADNFANWRHGYVVGDRITLGTGGALTTPIVMEITGTEGDGIFNIKGAEFDIDRPVNTVATDSMSILGLSSGAAERFSITSGGSSLLVQLLQARLSGKWCCLYNRVGNSNSRYRWCGYCKQSDWRSESW